MDTTLFDYPLPSGLIAQKPAAQRDASRLLVVNRHSGEITHATFADLPDRVPPGTAFFRNNATVLKARLRGQRAHGGAVECLLVRPGDRPERFWCLLKPGRKLLPGTSFQLPVNCKATVLEKQESGLFLVGFETPGGLSVVDIAEQAGEMPLPPYIRRAAASDRSASRALDEVRYQTVYADPAKKVAAAAPTAGLHFTPEIIDQLRLRGTTFHDLTLHVGLDTFRPIQTERVEDHGIHRECYEIPAATAHACASGDVPRLAVGTTSLRALEDFARKGDAHTGARVTGTPFISEANLFIYPPATFQRVDILLTNFHLPRSTLLCLVSAFLCPGKTDGIAWLKEIYAEAVARKYRFFSYGDAMLIL